MKEFNFGIPQDIIVGSGTLAKLSELSKKMGTHAFIISGPNLYKHGLVGRTKKYIEKAGIKTDVFCDIEANPSVDTVVKAAEAYKSSGADFIVALGGGSPMDVAKAVGVVVKYGGSIIDYEGADRVPGKIIPIIAIPTTAGTGSEVTAFSVITDHAREYKLTVFSYELLPEYVILDSDLIMTLPASVAAACGMDAFIHAEEAYVSTAATPFSEAMSEKAMELIGRSIRSFIANRTNQAASEDMMMGSLFAGIAFSFARLGNVHAMSHPISAFFDVPHGVANAVLLPTVVEYNAIADKGKYQKIYQYICHNSIDVASFRPQLLADAIRELCADIGIPKGIEEAVYQVPKNKNVTQNDITDKMEQMVADAMKSGNILVNPRSSTALDIERLYYEAL
ncbi:MAG: iron-containing alcohol dehydrogenase [Clostridia bacterium]|nr:iron-containing alcohol dehydrogenase [Clostridia bacterium]